VTWIGSRKQTQGGGSESSPWPLPQQQCRLAARRHRLTGLRRFAPTGSALRASLHAAGGAAGRAKALNTALEGVAVRGFGVDQHDLGVAIIAVTSPHAQQSIPCDDIQELI